MNTKLGYISVFAVGAAIGSVATWALIKAKYEKLAQEEIESVKSALSKKNSNDKEENKKESLAEMKNSMDLAKKVMEENNYTPYSKTEMQQEEEGEDMNKPYVISPEEFDENDDYETVSLTYYNDGVLADTITDEEIEDPEEMVGEFESHFGEFEDDSVFVRNDQLRCDYEILKDDRNFSDVVSHKYAYVVNDQHYE